MSLNSLGVEKLTAFRRRLESEPHAQELDRLLRKSLPPELEDLYLAQETVMNRVHDARMSIWIYDHLLEKIPANVKVIELPDMYRILLREE